jgi:hypothetical protein
MDAGLGVTVIEGDCAVGEDEQLHAATIRMARTEALICWLNAGVECQLRLTPAGVHLSLPQAAV